jgi:Uma2 family endonuclease
MVIATRFSNETYEQFALDDPDRKWELWDGDIREKPGMTFDHNWIASKLVYTLLRQLDWSTYQARVNAGRLHRLDATYFIPDVFVLPTAFAASLMHRPDVLEVYDQPLPLVVEIWSPSTGAYDLTEKLAVYRQRGDLEIWFIHPYERTLTAWRRLPDGSYMEATFDEGSVSPVALPGVVVELQALFDR